MHRRCMGGRTGCNGNEGFERLCEVCVHLLRGFSAHLALDGRTARSAPEPPRDVRVRGADHSHRDVDLAAVVLTAGAGDGGAGHRALWPSITTVSYRSSPVVDSVREFRRVPRPPTRSTK